MFLIQATMIDNILRGEFPRHPPAWVALGICLFLGTVLGALTFSFRPLPSLALSSLVGGGYAAGALVLFTRGGWLLPLVAPLSAMLAAYLLVTTVRYIETRAEKQRAIERLKYLGHLVDSAVEAIFSFDPSGTIASWNVGAARVYGWSEAEARDRHWSFLLTPEAKEPVARALAEVAAGRPVKGLEVMLAAKDGRTIPVEIAFSEIRNAAGAVVGTSAISQDLTEKKRMLEVLIQSEKLAEIGRMGSGIVHEIKNPLTSIMMMSEIISTTKDLPEKTLRYADVIQKESQRILRLSQNILSFARPQKPQLRAVDVNRVLGDTLGLVEYELKKGKVGASLALEPGVPPAWGDGEKPAGLPEPRRQRDARCRRAAQGCTFAGAAPPASGDGDGWSRVAVGEAPAGPVLTVQIADHGTGIQPGIRRAPTVLLDQGRGQGHGAGSLHLPQHHSRASRPDGGRQRLRPGDRVHDHPADGGGRGVAREARRRGCPRRLRGGRRRGFHGVRPLPGEDARVARSPTPGMCCSSASRGAAGAWIPSRVELCAPCRRELSLPAGELCPGCGVAAVADAGSFCPSCRGRSAMDAVVFAAAYAGTAKELVHRFKYRADFAAGRLLARLLAARIAAASESSTWSSRSRCTAGAGGALQRAAFARDVARQLGALRGCRHGAVAVSLAAPRGARPRTRGVRGAAPGAVASRRLLLVDDVLTTGATAEGCCAALKEAGAAWTGVAVAARVLLPLRRGSGARAGAEGPERLTDTGFKG
jgi:PAS domain S-box-containing protein